MNRSLKKLLMLAVGFSLWCCVSCSNEDTPMEVSDMPVSFSAESDWADLQPASRADGEDYFQAGATMGVFAHYLPGGNEALITSSAPNFMFHEVVTKQQNGSWTYSPVKYWPNNPSDKVKFVAYTPMSPTTDDIAITSSNTQIGYPTLTYTLQTGKTDLLAASPAALGKQDIDDKVMFNFQHILGQVNVKVKAADYFVWVDDESIKVVSVNLVKIKRVGSFQFGMNDDNQWQWTTTGQPEDLLITSGTTFMKSTNNGNVVNGFPVFLLPTELEQLEVKLKTTINGTAIEETVPCTLDSPIAVAPNVNYVITIILNRDKTGFMATADWIRTESHDIFYDKEHEIDGHK